MWQRTRSVVALWMACEMAVRDGVGLLLLQEPYNVKGEMIGMIGRWYYYKEEEEVWTAVGVFDEEMAVVMDRRYSGKYVASVKVVVQGEKMVVISAYCRPSCEILVILNQVIHKILK